MSPRFASLDPRNTIESCTFQLHSWRPFHLPNTLKTLDSSDHSPIKPSVYSSTKRPCLSDRSTSFPVDFLDASMSKLGLFEHDCNEISSVSNVNSAKLGSKFEGFRWIARKRRRRGSRSVSGRSSDRSGTRRRCCSVGASAAYATCSDFMVANGTDSSGELFVNVGMDVNWGSDVSEAKGSVLRKEREGNGNAGGGVGERENLSGGVGQIGSFEGQGNESGYGSEPGYRGDAELGYGDEFDEEEDDPRLMFWGHHFGDSNMEIVGENTLQKTHHRCRRKKQDLKMVDLYH